ncbi:MAG: L-aspartate oxidase [Planctomycetota bacterium]|nr:L-aspartate oxidase [Planctomycetota bacterium]
MTDLTTPLHRCLLTADVDRIARYRFDVVVIGTGAAGASVALSAAARGLRVAVLGKAPDTKENNTNWARGGIAAVLDSADSFEDHERDTINCGVGLCDPTIVRDVVKGGPVAIERLVRLGAEFDRGGSGDLELGMEGGHSRRRIVHANGDATGRVIQSTLGPAIENNDRISLFHDVFAIDLVDEEDGRIVGVLVRLASGDLACFQAGSTVLACGGGGQMYRETTNPVLATADGVAMAYRAGAQLRDLEFFQFHPTCLYIAGAARVLISEIARGAGGVLRDRDGIRFMPEYHPEADLAPRDIVSRAAADRMDRTSHANIYLDLTAIDGNPHELFPSISATCRLFDIDIARQLIPVRPGAHYMIGGVQADSQGRTSLPGLFAVGECASTGLHGANRMGSNSLLEALVLGTRTGDAVEGDLEGTAAPLRKLMHRKDADVSTPVQVNVTDVLYAMKSLMWRSVGVRRNADDLVEANKQLTFWSAATQRLAPDTIAAWELMNMLTVARLATISALERKESRGAHFRHDYPASEEAWRRHTIIRVHEIAAGHLGEPSLSHEAVNTALSSMPVEHA